MISSLDFLPVFQDGFLQTVWTCCCPPLCLCFGFCLPLQLSKFSEVTKTNILLTVCTPLKFFVRSPSFPPVFLYFILFLLIVLTYHSIFSPIYFLILIYSLLPPLPFPSFFESESRSVVSDSLQPHGLYSPWNSPGQNTEVGSRSLLQGIFPTQGSKPGLPHCRQILYSWATREALIGNR